MPARGDAFLDVRNITVQRGASRPQFWNLLAKSSSPNTVLQNVVFQLNLGDQVTIFGPEASGKSTLLRTITGAIPVSSGEIFINGRYPQNIDNITAGYISPERSLPSGATVASVLHVDKFKSSSEVFDALTINSLLDIPANSLSTAQKVRVQLARALILKSPLLLLDDIADVLGVDEVKKLLAEVFTNHTAIVSTRSSKTAENLDLPLLLLHRGAISHSGTREEIAGSLACPRTINAWIEGLQYNHLRSIRRHPGVKKVIIGHSPEGHKLQITLQSGTYIPSLYNLLSQSSLIRVQEVPPSLRQIISRL